MADIFMEYSKDDIDQKFLDLATPENISNINEQLADIATVIVPPPSGGDDTHAIQTALNSITQGTILFPNGAYTVSDTLSLNASNVKVLFSKNTTLTTSVLTNTKNAFLVTGNNVELDGLNITSPTQWDGANAYYGYGVIHTNGSNITIRNCILTNVYQVGIEIKGGQNILVEKNRIHGNYPESNVTINTTGQFGIEYNSDVAPNGNVLIQNNFIDTCIQGVFIGDRGGSTGYGINISNNIFMNCYNHGVYSNGGNGNVISNNSFRQCQTALAVWGKYAVIENNNIFTSDLTDSTTSVVGISVREPIGCIIQGNVIKGNGLTNATIIDLSNLPLDPTPNTIIERNIVSNNNIEITNGKVIAINVGKSNQTQVNQGNIITHNIIKACVPQYDGLIQFNMISGYYGRDNIVDFNQITLINDNTTAVEGYGIQLLNQQFSSIIGNKVRYEYDGTSTIVCMGIRTVACSFVTVEKNKVLLSSSYGANLDIRALRDDSSSSNNTFRDNLVNIDTTKGAIYTALQLLGTNTFVEKNMISSDPMSGSVTFGTTARYVVVNNKNISGFTKVILQPTDSTSATLLKTSGIYVTYQQGTGFTLYTADNSTPATSATFNYMIV